MEANMVVAAEEVVGVVGAEVEEAGAEETGRTMVVGSVRASRIKQHRRTESEARHELNELL